MYKTIKNATHKIAALKTTSPGLKIIYDYTDDSVQSEIRLSDTGIVSMTVDSIHYPKSLDPEINAWDTPTRNAWVRMRETEDQIIQISAINRIDGRLYQNTPSRSKSSQIERAAMIADWTLTQANKFIAMCNVSKREITKRRKQISTLTLSSPTVIHSLSVHPTSCAALFAENPNASALSVCAMASDRLLPIESNLSRRSLAMPGTPRPVITPLATVSAICLRVMPPSSCTRI